MIKGYYVQIPPHLSDVLADLGGVSPDDDFDTIIDAGRQVLFNFNYPISAADKTEFEVWFCNHYIMHRVGSGNIKKWRQMFKSKMLDVMPYYKQLLDSEHLEFDPLINHDITTTDDYTGETDTDVTSTERNLYNYTRSGTDNTDIEKNITGHRAGVTEDGYHETREGEEDETVDTTKSVTTNGGLSENTSGTRSGNETTHNTEINRYSDTPQGDSGAIWEIGAGGTPQLTNRYLTDIRGITNDGSRQYSENTTGTKAQQTSGTENETDSSEREKSNGETVDGTRQSDTTEDTRATEVTDNDRAYQENGNDSRNIQQNSTTGVDTSHNNENYKLGVSGVSKSELLNKYRETFMRIRQLMTEDFDELFYNLYEVDDILDYEVF